MSVNLEELNAAQREAVLCCDAPTMIIAGAGSGKTRVITYKIAYLLEQGYRPWDILALTFTNKAADEMKARIATLVGEEKSKGIWMGTFHSIFARILRREAERLGFTSDFTIYDAIDSKNMVHSIVKELGLDEKKYKSAPSRISNAKNALLLPSEYRSRNVSSPKYPGDGMTALGDVYEHYFRRCRQSNAMDFDDILLYTWLLFRDNPDIANSYAERFRYVLVDEYQDTNYAQHAIVRQLTGLSQRVCVVGDDAQSIYSFRGAEIENILRFRESYQGVKVFKLEENFRSTRHIVQAANSLIRHNRQQIRKDVYSNREEGSPVEVFSTYSDIDEAYLAARLVRRYVEREGLDYARVAVLYRTNAQSRTLEEVLRKQGIPYRIYGGMSFFQHKEVKDLTAYLRLAVNPYDEESLHRIINYPARGIGSTTVERIFHKAASEGRSPWDVLSDVTTIGVNRGLQAKLEGFVEMIRRFNDYASHLDAFECTRRIIGESEMYKEIFHSDKAEDKQRQENLQEVLNAVASFVKDRIETEEGISLTHYLQEVSLLTEPTEEGDAGADRVSLMTIHSAKGLEFAAVIVVGLEENLFPSQSSLESPRQMEEERRLMYVAMTRAERYLALTYAKSRIRYGKTEYSEPSRFLREIDPSQISAGLSGYAISSAQSGSLGYRDRLAVPRRASGNMAPPSSYGRDTSGSGIAPSARRLVRVDSSASMSPSPSPQTYDVRPGTVIEHERFGVGRVEKVTGSGIDAKATVSFENAGTKQLMLKFARFKVVACDSDR